MRTIPGYPDSKRLIQQPVGRVMLDNQWQQVKSIDLTRSLGTGLPAQIAGVDGLVSATGTVRIKDPKLPGAVVSGFNLPWGARPGVRTGQGVNIELGDTGAYGRVLTGRVDDVTGSATSADLSFTVADRIDRLYREVSIPPLSERHPSPEGFDHMRIGLHPTFVTNWIARHSGFHATPPLWADAVVSAPMVGSSWPEAGTIVRATGNPASNPYPRQRSTPWGLATSNLEALYRPNLDRATGRLNRWMYVHCLIAPPMVNAATQLRAQWPSGDYLTIRFFSNSPTAQWLQFAHVNAAGDIVSAGDIRILGEHNIGPGGAEVEVWIDGAADPNSMDSVVFRLNGVQQTDRLGELLIPAEFKTTPMDSVRFFVDGEDNIAVGGLQVGFANSIRHLSEAHGAWERTAIIETETTGALQNVPAIVKRNALELLKEQAGGELAAIWIDGQGRFRYRSRERLLNAAPSFELDFNDIEGIDWSISRTAAMRKLTVKWMAPRTWRSTEPRIDLWQGNGGTILDGDLYEEIVHPEEGVDWINVDSVSELDNTGPLLWRFNNGYGSWVSGVLLDLDAEGSDREIPAPPSHYNTGFGRLDSKSYLIRVEPLGLNGRQLVLRAPSYPTMPTVRQGINTPMLRGRGRVQWTEQETVIFDLTGPEYRDLPEYVHDAGHWVQTLGTAQGLGGAIGADVTDPRPVLSTVPLVKFDDRRELADVCIVRTPAGHPDLRCLVVKDENSLTNESAIKRTQTLALQVIDEIQDEEAA